MQATLPQPVAKLMSDFCTLSEEHKVLFEQVLEAERTISAEGDIPQWHMDILKERERQWLAGEDQGLPLDEAFARIRQQLALRRMERSA